MFKIAGRAAMLTGTASAALWAVQAEAAGTVAGTNIDNSASVSFSVGGAAAQSVTSNTARFVVDRKVNLTVAEVGGAPTLVSLGGTDQVTTFTVTNLTNAVQDFRLDPDQQNVSIPLLGTDNFDVSLMRAFVDSNGNGIYEPTLDTATYIDELAADASVTVFIVANIPSTPGASTAIVSLNAIAASGGVRNTLGADLVATSALTADNPLTVDVVFADDTGLLDQPRNGAQRAFDSYRIATAAVTMGKTSRVISDPINLTANPRAIPGATLEYCLTVNNAGPGTVTGVTITDSVPANTTYQPNSLTVGGVGVGGACVLNGSVEDDDVIGADETDLYGGSFDGTTVTAILPSVSPLTPVTAAFRVTVN
jgi:uncharacterized repeat protein (TIGR01451 family)